MLRVLDEIRIGIVETSGDNSYTVQQINGLIDIPLLEQRVDSGSFEWDESIGLVGAVVEVVQGLQEVTRVDDTRNKYSIVRSQMEEAGSAVQLKPKAFCDSLEFLLGRVSLLRIDFANKRWVVVDCVLFFLIFF